MSALRRHTGRILATPEDESQASARLSGKVEAHFVSAIARQCQEKTGAVVGLLNGPAVKRQD